MYVPTTYLVQGLSDNWQRYTKVGTGNDGFPKFWYTVYLIVLIVDLLLISYLIYLLERDLDSCATP